METRASYTLVGAFVLALMAALFVFVVWLAKIQFDRASQPYHIFFTGTVTGLVEGSPVRYRGVAVGTVRDIRIDPTNVERVRVTVEVPEETPIKADAIASLEPVGVTGGVYVEIAGGTREAPLLKDGADGIPVIASRPSSIAAVLEQAPRLIENLIKISNNLNAILGEDNQKAVASTLANLAAAAAGASGTLKGTDALVADLRKEVKAVSKQAQVLMENANRTVESVGKDAGAISSELAKTAVELNKLTVSLVNTSNELGALVSENRGPVRDFTNGALFELGGLITQLQALAANLNRVTSRLERDPSELIFGGRTGGVEVK